MSSSPAPRPARGQRLWVPAAAILVFANLAVWAPPWAPRIPTYGGPDSWREVLCHFAGSGLRMGTDLVYTTGPLGVLRQPLFCAELQGVALAWGLLQALAAALLFTRLFRATGALVSLVGLAVFLALPFLDGTPGTGLFFSLLAGSLFVEVHRRRPGLRWADLPLALVLAVGSWIVFTYLVTAVVVVGSGTVIYWLRFRRLSPAAATYLGLLMVVWFWSGQGVANLVPYLRTSVEISSGYGEVMARYGPGWEMGLAVLVFLGFAAAYLGSYRGRPDKARAFLLVALGTLFLLVFKASFLRHERPRISVVAVLVIAMALFHLAGLSRARLSGATVLPLRRFAAPWVAGALGLALVTNLSLLGKSPGALGYKLSKIPRQWRLQVDGLGRHLRGEDLFHRRAQANAAKVRTKLNLPKLTPPVDWYGMEAGKLVAAGVDYRPRPVFQSYVAYTPALAELNAAFYRSPQAPATVVVGLRPLSVYPPSLLDGRVLLELLASYRPAPEGTRSGPSSRAKSDFAIFERRPRSECELELVQDTGPVPVGRRVKLVDEARGKILWAEIDVGLTLPGHLVSWISKPSLLWLQVWMEDGSREIPRLAAIPARGGFLLSPLLRDSEDLLQLVESGAEGKLAARTVERLVVKEGLHRGPRHRSSYALRLYALSGCLEPAGEPSPLSPPHLTEDLL